MATLRIVILVLVSFGGMNVSAQEIEDTFWKKFTVDGEKKVSMTFKGGGRIKGKRKCGTQMPKYLKAWNVNGILTTKIQLVHKWTRLYEVVEYEPDGTPIREGYLILLEGEVTPVKHGRWVSFSHYGDILQVDEYAHGELLDSKTFGLN